MTVPSACRGRSVTRRRARSRTWRSSARVRRRPSMSTFATVPAPRSTRRWNRSRAWSRPRSPKSGASRRGTQPIRRSWSYPRPHIPRCRPPWSYPCARNLEPSRDPAGALPFGRDRNDLAAAHIGDTWLTLGITACKQVGVVDPSAHNDGDCRFGWKQRRGGVRGADDGDLLTVWREVGGRVARDVERAARACRPGQDICLGGCLADGARCRRRSGDQAGGAAYRGFTHSRHGIHHVKFLRSAAESASALTASRHFRHHKVAGAVPPRGPEGEGARVAEGVAVVSTTVEILDVASRRGADGHCCGAPRISVGRQKADDALVVHEVHP